VVLLIVHTIKKYPKAMSAAGPFVYQEILNGNC
jgi:hypothetical protein